VDDGAHGAERLAGKASAHSYGELAAKRDALLAFA